MALYTHMSAADAERLAGAHGLGRVLRVEGVAAGSVNSNYVLHTSTRPVFARIYEQSGVPDVDYEWALMAHLEERGVPAPVRVRGAAPGELLVEGKPTALFEMVGGEEVCQAMVTPGRAAAVGQLLAQAHSALDDFGRRQPDRFGPEAIEARLTTIEAAVHPQLSSVTPRLRAALAETAGYDAELSAGPIHGDLFRDNVRFEEERVVCALDWESASDGPRVFDLAVTVLAWCYAAELRWDLAAALVRAYRAERAPSAAELKALPAALRAAAARFTVTRITDFFLVDTARGAAQVKKDYRRFLARLDAVPATSAELEARLSEG